MANFPARVRLCECFCRDGLQNRPEQVSTDQKVRLVDFCTDAGFDLIEVTSFAHPKYLPQFSDSAEVLARIKRKKGVQYIALVPNEKGMDRCLELLSKGAGPTAVTVILAASEAYSKKNVKMTVAEAVEGVKKIVPRAKQAGLYVIGSISNSFGCHMEGDIPFERVARLAKEFAGLGADEIQFGDTTGQANPVQAEEFFTKMKREIPKVGLVAHFHDSRGVAIANSIAALRAGVERFDGSFGGIGGRPRGIVEGADMRYTGNLTTEDWICLLHELGAGCGVSKEKAIEGGKLAEEILGEKLFGHVTEAGPAVHQARTGTA